MKKTIIYSCIASAICLLGCEKNEINVAKFELVKGKAFFKVNYSSPYAKNPAVQLKINGERISNTITYSTPFPGGGLNTGGSSSADYLSLSTGKTTLSISIPKTGTSEDSVLLYTTEVNLQADVYQTLHVTDTTDNTQSVMVTDMSSKPDSGVSKFRFVNLIPGSKIDLLFGTTVLAEGIDYKNATDTFSIVAGTVQQFRIRVNGTATNIGTYPTTVSGTYTIPNQRAMTIYARGYLGMPTSDVRRPHVSLLFNK